MSFKSTWLKVTRKTGEIMDSKGSSISIGVGIGCFAVAVVTAVIATIKAEEKLDELDAEIAYECEHEHKEPPDKKTLAFRRAKVLVPVAAPTVISFTIGTVLVVTGHKKDLKKLALVTSAFNVSEMKRRELTNYIHEHMGEKAEKELREAFYEEKSKKDMPEGPKDPNIISSGRGDQLFYDCGTGRYFRASVIWLEKCQQEISHRVFTDDYASANELADMLGLPCTTYGNLLGWNTADLDNSSKLIDMSWTHCSMSDWGEPYGILEYDVHERFREF